MRYIHPVGQHETFVASGTYRYWIEGRPTGALEHWSIHEMPDGAGFIRIDSDHREMDGRSRLMEAWRNPNGQIERFEVYAYGKPAEHHEVKATYLFEADKVLVRRVINHDDTHAEALEIDLPKGDYLVEPKATLFEGITLAALFAHQPTLLPIFRAFVSVLPDVPSLEYFGTYPAPELIRLHGEETLTLGQHAHLVQHYSVQRQYEGKPMRVGGYHFWLDSHGILLKGDLANGHQVEQLERYAHR